MGTVVIVNKDQMGNGDRDLGIKILASCLRKMADVDQIDAIVFYNGGVKLLTADSPIAMEIGLLKERGIDILPCGTCVNHFDLAQHVTVGPLSNMDEILAALTTADKVITL